MAHYFCYCRRKSLEVYNILVLHATGNLLSRHWNMLTRSGLAMMQNCLGSSASYFSSGLGICPCLSLPARKLRFEVYCQNLAGFGASYSSRPFPMSVLPDPVSQTHEKARVWTSCQTLLRRHP